jgi:glycosyltransferase involved in cell wall biosynthesis
MTSKIAVNARYQYRRVTGVERYALEISKRIQPTPRMIAPNKALGQINGHLWEQFSLPFQLQKNEILWSPANTGAWIVRDQVVTIHDASVFDHPEWFRPAFAAWTRLSWKVLANRAKAIITVSEFSRERLKYHLKISNQKIHVIPNGVGKPFEPQPTKTINEIKRKYDLNKPYFLFIGTHEPRKNLVKLIGAFGKLKTSTHLLAIAGDKGKVFADPVSHALSVTYAEFLGYIPDSDLPALYSGAGAVIISSLYEGFGLITLEAMACGTPVIASNTTSFPETTGDAALLVDPNKVEEIKNAMLQIIENPTLVNSLRERGLQRAAQFSWDESARKTQEIISDSHL